MDSVSFGRTLVSLRNRGDASTPHILHSSFPGTRGRDCIRPAAKLISNPVPHAPFIFWHPRQIVILLTLLCAATTGAQQPRPAEETEPSDPPPPPARSRVVVSEDPSLVNRFYVDEDRVKDMFNRNLMAYARRRSVAEAWRSLVDADDTVGIKINTLGGPVLSTHRVLVEAIVQGLGQAGVPPERVIVWDKFEHTMVAAGYVPMAPHGGWQCRAVVPGTGFDPKRFYFHELAGRLIWGDLEFQGSVETARAAAEVDRLVRSAAESVPYGVIPDSPSRPAAPPRESSDSSDKDAPQLSNRSHFATILTQDVTKIINIPNLADHDRLGIYGALASLAIGGTDNTRRFMNSSEPSATAIAEIMEREEIRDKTVLHIMDGLIAQFAGGPVFRPHYSHSAGLLMLSQDPVAIDALALERLEDWRREKGVLPIGDLALHVRQSAAYGVGTDQRSRMEIVSLHRPRPR